MEEVGGAVSTLEGRAAFQRDLDRLEKWIDMNKVKANVKSRLWDVMTQSCEVCEGVHQESAGAPATQEANWLYLQECSYQCEGSDYSDNSDYSPLYLALVRSPQYKRQRNELE